MAHGKLVKQQNLSQEVKNTLQGKERFGESKYSAKLNNTAKDGIYSYSTAKAYNCECQKFVNYVMENSPQGIKTSLKDAKAYAKDYIQSNNANPALSASTVKLQASALGKLYGCTSADFGITESRTREKITRSRERTIISEKTGKVILNPKSRADHFSKKNHSELVNFCRGTGLRRSELESLKGTQLVEKDGKAYLNIKGKDGRERLAPINGQNSKQIIERCKSAGKEKVWGKVFSRADIHHYRSQYASDLYNSLARERDNIPIVDRYCCRLDLKGTWYDKPAMKTTSEALGYNRISVIAGHYIR